MTQLPLISIIMPTHNAARFIAQAIESVLTQTYQNWELIIVDDASSDQTESIVCGYDDDRIRYHKVDRIGHPAGVRNRGLRLAQGALIAFLDSDDWYFPEALEKLSKPLIENEKLSAVYGFALNMNEHGVPLPQSIQLIPRENPQPGEPAYTLPKQYQHSWEHIATSKISCMLPALMLRRSAQESIGFFNETLCGPEDYEFYIRLFLHDYDGVMCLSDYVYHYRIHAASLTKAPEHCETVLRSCMRIMDWLFHEVALPLEIQPIIYGVRSKAYVAPYRYLARERLLHHQPELTRAILRKAFMNPYIDLDDFVIQCVPLWLRSLLPIGWDQRLVSLRQKLFAQMSRLRYWQQTLAVQEVG